MHPSAPWRLRPTSWMLGKADLWLDSAHGLYQEITGASATTPAVNDGDLVGTWRARTGQYFVAPSDAARPTLRVIAGRKWVVGDGTDDTLTATMAFEVNVTGYGLWAVASANGAISSSFRPMVRMSSTNQQWGGLQWNQDTTSFDTFANENSGGALRRTNSGSGALSDGVVFQTAAGWDAAGSLRHVRNGTAITPTAMTTPQPSNGGSVALYKHTPDAECGPWRLGEIVVCRPWFPAGLLAQLTHYGRFRWASA